MKTETLTLEVGSKSLAIEQVAALDDLARQSMKQGTDPYWAYLWPSAISLIHILSDGPDLTGRRVLDLGCGLGAVGLAAALKGARVVLTDLRPEAIALAQTNADRNGLDVTAMQMDWNAPPPDLGTFDGILAADVMYGDGMLRGVLRFIRRQLNPGGLALITDPMRVQPGGVMGAARLNGLATESRVLVHGQVMTGGVTLYTLRHGARLLRRPR